MKEIIEWGQMNPGALTFLREVYVLSALPMFEALTIDLKLRRCESIRGENLYVLYSDLCDRDLARVVKLCANCPDAILEDACGRDDYSGRELVKEYF